MAFTWGSMQLKVIKDSYVPPYAENAINEIAILPDSSGNPASVLQQGGRGRYRVDFDGVCDSYADYQSLMADSLAGTQRIFTGADGFSDTMMIQSLSPAVRRLYPTRFEYSITLVEA